jgi:hypothetical protein
VRLAGQLSATSVERVTKQLRKLPWKEPGVQRWFVQTMLECAEVKYHTVQLVACVASGLVKAQEASVVRFVDCAGPLRRPPAVRHKT